MSHLDQAKLEFRRIFHLDYGKKPLTGKTHVFYARIDGQPKRPFYQFRLADEFTSRGIDLNKYLTIPKTVRSSENKKISFLIHQDFPIKREMLAEDMIP